MVLRRWEMELGGNGDDLAAHEPLAAGDGNIEGKHHLIAVDEGLAIATIERSQCLHQRLE